MAVSIHKVNGVDIAFEMHGQEAGPLVCLIQGLGLPLTAWPADFIQGFIERGFSVLTIDNRDIGRSQLQSHLGIPNLKLQILLRKLGFPAAAPYHLTDMMKDTLGLLQVLEVPKAHVVGMSMGGMIGQLLAIHAPEKVASLTSIMSTTGRRGLPGARADVRRHILSRPVSNSAGDRMDFNLKTWELIGSPAYPRDVDDTRAFVLRNFERGMTAEGIARQFAAIVAGPGRHRQLRKINIPSLVIHGDSDRLVPPQCGMDTARSIPGATLKIIPGMGHDLPAPLLGELVGMIAAHARRAEGRPA